MPDQPLNPIKISHNPKPHHPSSHLHPPPQPQPQPLKSPINPLNHPKPPSNIIKINKAKLPHDFFPKCLSFDKKPTHRKPNLYHHSNNNHNNHLFLSNPHTPLYKPRRVESERLHISPQKTSFFGFFQSDSHQQRNPESRTIALKRKFQTRQQPKRDNSQLKRRFTPASNIHRNDLIDLFPPNYDPQITEIIASNSSARMNKISPRKQYQSKYQQSAHDTQKEQQESFRGSAMGDIYGNGLRNIINLRTVEREEGKIRQQISFIKSQTVDLHNMTFFNAKSSCLPPIKKI